MKIVKIAAIVIAVYALLVVAFESWLGYSQPSGAGTIVISTRDDAGNANPRVVSRLTSGGQLYVAANHWPRAWYRQALKHPEVTVVVDGEPHPYRAVPVEGQEHDRVSSEHPTGLVFRILTGFPPRYFVRLEPLADIPPVDGPRVETNAVR